MSSFSQLAIEHSPWSMSKASLAENCPLSFHFKYSKKLKEREAPEASAARIGRTVHRLLEESLKGTLGPDEKGHILKICIQEKLTSPEIEEAMSYLHNVRSFVKRLDVYKTRHPVQETFVERSFGFTQDLQPVPPNKSFFRGVWDLVLLVGDYAVILDHKTGETPTQVSPFQKHQVQYRCYAIAALTQFPGLKGIQMAFHYVQDEKIIWEKPDPTEHIQGEYLPWYEQYINRCAEQGATLSPRKSWFCAYCGYTHMCPLKQQEN